MAGAQGGYSEVVGSKYVSTDAYINLENGVLWNEVRNRIISIRQCHLCKLKMCAQNCRKYLCFDLGADYIGV